MDQLTLKKERGRPPDSLLPTGNIGTEDVVQIPDHEPKSEHHCP